MVEKCACTMDELASILRTTAFLKPYDFRVSSCSVGECQVLVPFDRSLERPGGIVSGMTLMGAADVAMWLAIMTHRGTTEKWVTTDMKTVFLKAAVETNVYCQARLLKLGKRTSYGTVDTRNEEGQLLAHHVVSYAHVSGTPE